MPGRSFTGTTYRYGFNGKEKQDEFHNNSGDVYDYGDRIYDARTGRWLSLDPLQRKFPSWSPYNFTECNPILLLDMDGRDVLKTTDLAGKPKVDAALDLVTKTNIGKTFLLQFARANQTPGAGQLNVNLGATDPGMLAGHNIVFGVHTKDQGATGLQIKNSDGTFVDYTGQDFGAEAQFQITIDVDQPLFYQMGGQAYNMSHEMIAHAEFIATALVKFEEAKKAANGDPEKMNQAIATLKDALKSTIPESKEMEKKEFEEHKQIATGKGLDVKLKALVGELKKALPGDAKYKEKQKESINAARAQDKDFQKQDTQGQH